MSYDLMVFRKDAAPTNKSDFMDWYKQRTQWNEDHDYDDPANTSTDLHHWFLEMIDTFPALNGPFASEDMDDPRVSDYSIDADLIYVGFRWSEAEAAYVKVFELAAKHRVGFFDASGTGDVYVPDKNGHLKIIINGEERPKPWWKFW